MLFKKILKKNKKVFSFFLKYYKIIEEIKLLYVSQRALGKINNNCNTVFYLGIPAHSNLGDLAQGVCIRNWISNNYKNYNVVEIETNALVNTRFSVLKKLKKKYKENDVIIFQSGYTTTDLGGYADIMHKAVINELPKANFLMMPQTIFFKNEDRRRQTSEVYSKAENMLFLARDAVSYKMALEMFENINIKLYPDIVTSLIGKKQYNNEREGLILCARDDSEKYYTDEQLEELIEKCKKICKVDRSDTTKNNIGRNEIVKNAKYYINKEIEMFSKYKVTVTDRYHGTILSLAAGTPVIIIKTTDHKVTTGADWFKGIYDDYVYLANDLEEAYDIFQTLYNKDLTHKLNPYFEEKYYSDLKEVFEKSMNSKEEQ